MKMKTLLAVTTIGTVLTLSARAEFVDNFDSYANQSAFNAVWAADTGSALALKSDVSFSSPNAISQSTTVAARVHTLLDSSYQGSSIDFSYELYYTANSTRDFAQVYSRVGSDWTSGVNGTATSIGTFVTTTAGKWAGRASGATPVNGAIFGDGATIISTSDTTGWFALNISRSTGWHKMEILGAVDTAHAGKAIYKFYVDGALGGSVANAPDYLFNFGVLGGANSSGTGAATDVARYDNFDVKLVPEPSSVALAVMGGFALAVGAIARRKI